MSENRFSPWMPLAPKDLRMEEILASALSSASIGIAVLDRDFNILLANETFTASIATGTVQTVGRNFFDLHPDAENQAIFAEVVSTGRSYFFSGQPLNGGQNSLDAGLSNGHWDWSLRPVFDPDGQLVYLVLMLTDVSAQELIHQELQEKELLLGQLFEMAPDGNLLVDHTGKIRQANRQAVMMFGFSAEELAGKPVELLVPETNRRQHARERVRYQSKPYTRPMGKHADFCARHKDGSEFPVEIKLSPIATPQGDFVLCTIRDISQQRQAEAELTEMRRRLLISAESEKNALARDLHDSAIQDLYAALYELQLINEELSPDSQQVISEVVETIKEVNNRLRTTIADLRPTTLISFGLEKAIRSYASRFQEAYPEIDLDLELDGDIPQLTDEIRLDLYRICIQLLTNAALHSDASTIWIRLKMSVQRAILEVQDNGRGFIPPTRWIQLAREGRLGLIDVTERTQGMGGEIKIDSRPGRGTLVRVAIPFSQEALA